MKNFLAAASVLAMLSSGAQAADEPAATVFKPAGQWQADFGDDYCRLARPFSDGKNTLSIALERIQPTNSVRLMFVGDGIKTYRNADQLEYVLSPKVAARKGTFWSSKTGDGQQFISLGEVMLGTPPKMEPGKPPAPAIYDRAAEQEFVTGITALELTGGVSTPVRIETGAIKAAITTLQQCSDDLLSVWELDAEKHKTMTRAAAPTTATDQWIPSTTLGFGDFGKLGDSANQIRVMVSAEGKPTACVVNRPALDKGTNDTICKGIMQKAQFLPALDAQGQAMASYWMVTPFQLVPPMRT